ncbi:hypothetical protein [Halopelagius longus]|nr:hypothetical protein [Halopelagius longus]SDQ09587.1 hypothetical protein SAMN05216278_0372 [Halopelagius longus]
MAMTHVAVGLALAAPVALVAPDLAPAALAGSLAGGVFPDLDMVVGEHRRTLHVAEAYALSAVVCLALAAVVPSALSTAAAAFFVAATLHPIFDLAGGSTEARPWEAATNRGVYLRSAGGWVAPRRWIRYDGAPADFALAVVLAVPGLVLYGPTVRAGTVALLVVGALYTLARKRIPQLSGRVELPVPPVLTAVVTVVSFFRR